MKYCNGDLSCLYNIINGTLLSTLLFIDVHGWNGLYNTIIDIGNNNILNNIIITLYGYHCD